MCRRSGMKINWNSLKTYVPNRHPPRRPSSIWYELVSIPKGVEILDPDGWDRKNFNYSWYKECITEQEYEQRVAVSTLSMRAR